MNQDFETLNLVKTYFNICNAALVKGRGSPFIGSVGSLFTRLVSPAVVILEVADDDRQPPAAFRTEFVDGQFKPVREACAGDAGATFLLSRHFLQRVSENAEFYIANPEKLDWGWLKQGITGG